MNGMIILRERGESARSGGSARLHWGTHGRAERMRWLPRFCPESNRNMVVRDGMVPVVL